MGRPAPGMSAGRRSLDARVRGEHALAAATDTTASVLYSVEQIFPEPGGSGLSAQLTELWTAFAGVANDPASPAVRRLLVGKARAAARTLNRLSDALAGLGAAIMQELSADLASASDAALDLAVVNGRLAERSGAHGDTTALVGQRDALLDCLSRSVGAVATSNANATADVSVAGQPLVTGLSSTVLRANRDEETPGGATASPGSRAVVTLVGTATVTLNSGAAAARVGALAVAIPHYTAQLDAIADGLCGAVNRMQLTGYDLCGASGADAFAGTGAAGIDAVIDHVTIAASSTPGGNLGNSNALAASALGTLDDGPDARYASLVGDVAAASRSARQRQAVQTSVANGMAALSASLSGASDAAVLSSLLEFEQACADSAQVLMTLDGALHNAIHQTELWVRS